MSQRQFKSITAPAQKKRVHRISVYFALFVLFAIGSTSHASSDNANDVTCTHAAIPPLPRPRVGSFVGTSAGSLIVAGGSSVEGSFSDEIDVLPPGAGDWRIEHLQQPCAWGASIALDDSLICIGGESSGKCSRHVFQLRWNSGKLIQRNLPDLPAPRAGAGAAVLGKTIYVIGGIAQPESNRPTRDLFVFDTAAPAPAWRTGPPIPSPGVAQPCVVGQYYGIEVFGGRTVKNGSVFTTTDACWVYRPKPLDFTETTGWIHLASLPQALAQGTAIDCGQAHTFLVGADSQPTAPNIESAWKTGVPFAPILAYHAVTDAWATLGRSIEAAAGRSAVQRGPQTLLVGGAVAGRIVSDVQQLSVHPIVRGLHLIDYVVIVGYILLITCIGLTFSRKQKTTEEFSLGGRGTPWWVAALSLYATATSSISLMAVPALTYATNLVWLFQPIISIFVLIPQAFIAIPLIRRLNLTSTYEYLERRFNAPLRLLASLQCIAFYTIARASVVILIPSIAISAVTGLNVYVAILGVGLLTTIYTSLGGIDAVMWTDVLQAFVMLLGPLIVIGVILYSFRHNLHDITAIGSRYGKFDLVIWSWTATQPAAWIMMLTVALTVTGFAGEQAMVQRVLATPNDNAARKATIGNWIVCVGGAAIVQIMGTLLFIYFHAHPAKLDPTMQNDRIVPLFVVQVMPVGVAGLIIAGIFAASMSCLSGIINSAATLMVQDFYLRWRPRSSDRTRLRLTKFLSYVVGLVGTAMAVWLTKMPMRSLMETLTTMVSLCGAGFVGVYTLGMFTRRANAFGAMTGAITSVFATFLVAWLTPLHWTLYTPLAVVTCIVVGYAASLLTPATERDLTGLTAYTTRTTASTFGVLAPIG